MSRQLIVVDTETTGLHEDAAILEIAAINVDTGYELEFAPYVHPDAFAKAEPAALAINRYFERGVWERRLSGEACSRAWGTLSRFLHGTTLAGSNPAFDAGLLARTVVDFDGLKEYSKFGTPWHHRLLDLSAYAAGRLGIDPTELPGLSSVCDRLGVVNENPHSALGDARATAECFRILRRMQ